MHALLNVKNLMKNANPNSNYLRINKVHLFSVKWQWPHIKRSQNPKSCIHYTCIIVFLVYNQNQTPQISIKYGGKKLNVPNKNLPHKSISMNNVNNSTVLMICTNLPN